MELPPALLGTAQIILCVAMVLSILRVWIGPSLMDRIVALDLLAALIMGQCIVLVLASRFVSYLDIAAAIAVIAYIATVAISRYLERGRE